MGGPPGVELRGGGCTGFGLLAVTYDLRPGSSADGLDSPAVSSRSDSCGGGTARGGDGRYDVPPRRAFAASGDNSVHLGQPAPVTTVSSRCLEEKTALLHPAPRRGCGVWESRRRTPSAHAGSPQEVRSEERRVGKACRDERCEK